MGNIQEFNKGVIQMRDIAIRAGKTFLQTFLSALAIGIVAVDSVDSLLALLIACGAAGISAIQNTFLANK